MNNSLSKIWQFSIILLIIILLVTNPGIGKYETYASQQLITYFKNDVCPQITEFDRIETACGILIDTARPQIKIASIENTRQQNFLLFSLYQTNFALPPIIPEYNFITLGIADRFFTYQSESSQSN